MRTAVFYLTTLVLITGCAAPIEYSRYGLRPLDPAPEKYGVGKVHSFQPVLRWEEFPRSQDRVVDQGGLVNRISEVTYELRIFETRDDRGSRPGGVFAGNVVYARKDLTTTTHQIEVMLKPSTYYLWTVRARYLLDGMNRVTDWGHQVRDSVPIKSIFFASDKRTDLFFGYYEFTTPPPTPPPSPPSPTLMTPDAADAENAKESEMRSTTSF